MVVSLMIFSVPRPLAQGLLSARELAFERQKWPRAEHLSFP